MPVQHCICVWGRYGKRAHQRVYVCRRERGKERECVGGKDIAAHGKSDLGLKVLRLRVLGLRSEDIIVMFCFH